MLILGINHSQMRESSVCLVRDGELLFAVFEERMSRAKYKALFLRSPFKWRRFSLKCQPKEPLTRYT